MNNEIENANEEVLAKDRVTGKKQTRQRKVGSPPKNQSRASRPTRERVPVSGFRDILTVYGKDPNYVYRWVKDGSDSGQRIWRFRQAAYDFVTVDEVEGVGQDMVFHSEDLGSIIRIPEGKESHLYLMKIHKDFYEEDQNAKEKSIAATEAAANAPLTEGQYGEGTISRSLRRPVSG